MTVLAPYLKQRFVDSNGNALFKGTVTTYQAGTTTPIATYPDSTGGTANANPITLNVRGECDIWLLPNVAYKFVVTDVNGNPVWTEDNVIQSQLITLYGGVDTGTANAYVLNFTASFASLIDGIVIYWIPAHTNTGASTINVNGLGVVAIINPDGSALTAAEILANQPATILYKGGNFILTSVSVDGNAGAVALSGFTATVNTTVTWRRYGKVVIVNFTTASGTSSTSSFFADCSGISLPVSFATAQSGPVGSQFFTDNGANVTDAQWSIGPGSQIIQFLNAGNSSGWTNSGTKAITLSLTFGYFAA